MSADLAPAPLPPAATSGTVQLVGFEARAADEIRDRWRFSGVPLEIVAEPRDAAQGPDLWPAVVCFGPGVPPATAVELIEKQAETEPDAGCRYLMLGAGDEVGRLEALVERDLVFYLAPEAPAIDATLALIEAAYEHGAAHRTFTPVEPASRYLSQIAEIERGRGVEDTLERLEQAAHELIRCRHAACRWVDAESHTLWRPGDGDGRDSTATGLVGFVARTGRSVAVPRVGDDPRYDAEADNARRSRRERFAAVALPAGPGARQPTAVEAVLAVARGGRQRPFTAAEVRQLEHLAGEAGPILRRRRLAMEQERARSETEVFRSEALVHRDRGLATRSEPLRIAPAWLSHAYRVVLALCATGLLALPFAASTEYAVGPAVVRLQQRAEVRARAAGVLEQLAVRPGDAVQRGQEIGRLDSSEETAQLEQLRQELELRLVERLRHPDQPAATSAFVALREQQRVASARLERLRLRSPEDGLIGDLLVRPGRPLVAGQPIASVVVAAVASEPWIDVLLPGSYRPLLAPGMEVRFKIDGYADVELLLTVSEVSRQVISPQLASRIVEPSASRIEPTAGGAAGRSGLVIVRAELPAGAFDSQGRRYPYFDGMTGVAELRVRKRRLVVDWLRSLM